jgi:hypothetical protein
MLNDDERQQYREAVLRAHHRGAAGAGTATYDELTIPFADAVAVDERSLPPRNEFICPLSREVMKDPVLLLQTGITYDRMHLCRALLTEPDVDPATKTRYDEKLRYSDNLLVRRLLVWTYGDDVFHRYDDVEFHDAYGKAWENRKKETRMGSSALSSSSGDNASLYERIEELLFGMNRSQIDMESAFALLNCAPEHDAILVGFKAIFLDPSIDKFYAKSCPKDSVQAELTWQKAADLGLRYMADQGNPWAQVLEGRRQYLTNTSAGMEEAYQWYLKAANSDRWEAYWLLGNLARRGDGVKMSVSNAVDFYLHAANRGHAAAQSNLGMIYFSGTGGFPKDYTMAVQFFRSSAEQGDDQGQFNLGYMYDHGLGVPQDYCEAAGWYGKAADQGHSAAIRRLMRPQQH